MIVVGDTCADFCYALACDRLLGGATWLPIPRLPEPVLDAALPGLSRHVTTISTMHGIPVPVTSVSLDTAAVERAREQLRSSGGLAFTDARTVVVASNTLSFERPVRLGDPGHLHLAETSAVRRDPADGSLHVGTALMTPVPDVARTAAPGRWRGKWTCGLSVSSHRPGRHSALVTFWPSSAGRRTWRSGRARKPSPTTPTPPSSGFPARPWRCRSRVPGSASRRPAT